MNADRSAMPGSTSGVGSVDEGVADGEVQCEGGSLLQGAQARRLERREHEPESGDRDRERVQVDAVYCVERLLHPGLGVQPGRVPVPAVEQPGERAEQEVPGPAGRVDHREPVQRPLGQRRLQRPVEDELLDEHRRLQQRVGVLGVLGQVLVQVAEEPRGQLGVGQVVDQRAVLAAPPPGLQQDGSPHHRTGAIRYSAEWDSTRPRVAGSRPR